MHIRFDLFGGGLVPNGQRQCTRQVLSTEITSRISYRENPDDKRGIRPQGWKVKPERRLVGLGAAAASCSHRFFPRHSYFSISFQRVSHTVRPLHVRLVVYSKLFVSKDHLYVVGRLLMPIELPYRSVTDCMTTTP